MSEHFAEGSNEAKPVRLIRLKEVMARVGMSRSTIYRRMHDGSFPRGHQIGEAMVAWTEGEIDAWITGILGA